MKPVTWASISNCKNTSVKAATTASLALLLAFAGGPARKRSAGGNSYVLSAVNKSCSGRLGLCAATGDTGIGTVNSSSNDSSSNSSSSAGSFQAATMGVSKGGVSVTSNGSSFILRSGRFDHSHVEVIPMRANTSLTGVAVTTKSPKIKIITSTGYVRTEVIAATKGVVTP